MPIHKISRVLSLQTGLSDWVLNQAENSCSRFAEPGYRTVEESTANPLHLSCLCCDSGEWIGGLWLSMHWDDWLRCFLIWDIECESNPTKTASLNGPGHYGLWTGEISLVRWQPETTCQTCWVFHRIYQHSLLSLFHITCFIYKGNSCSLGCHPAMFTLNFHTSRSLGGFFF